MPDRLIRPRGVFLDPPGAVVPGAVLARDGVIAEVRPPTTEFDAPPAGPEVVDLPEHVLLPGLINTHVHLSFSASAAPLAEYRQDTRETRLLRAVANAHTLLLSGVTTARDCGSDRSLLALGRSDLPTPAPLPRLLMCGPPITVPAGHLHMMGGEAAGRREIVDLVHALHRGGAGSIKVMATGGGMTPGTRPECATFSVEDLSAARDAARALGLPTVAHALAGEGVRRAALAGFDSLEHCAFFARTPEGRLERAYDPVIAAVVASSGAAVMMGLSTAYHALDAVRGGGPATVEQRFGLEQERRMVVIFEKLHALGIPLICGTDAGVKHTPFDETHLELALMVEAGLSPLEAIRSATTRAAAALGRTRELGRVAVGYAADLIAVRGDPLGDPGVFAEVDWVMRGGEIVRTPERA